MFDYFRRGSQQAASKRREACEAGIRDVSQRGVREVLASLGSTEDGLGATEAERLLASHGANKISTGRKVTVAGQLIAAVVNPFNVVLIAVAVITFLTDVVLTQEEPDYATFIVIVVTIITSSAISFVQSVKSQRASQRLQNLVTNKARVVRGGTEVEVRSEDVVPGDVLVLAPGDMIPADVRFMETVDFSVDQSSLTGESRPVQKLVDAAAEGDLTDRAGIGFAGTNVIAGSARAVAFATGDDTYLGSIAQSLDAVDAKGSFQKGLASVSSLFIKFTALFVPLILVINILAGKGVWESVLFAISTAVGLTPEMLPVIVTSTLALGAMAMSREKTIVKDMGGIQSFGQMDVLCTDKTGTLTEDRVVVERYLSPSGDADVRVLEGAYLNSSYSTGIKNLIDAAILRRAEAEGVTAAPGSYRLASEVPFDFERRRMSVLLEDGTGGYRMVTKGAVEEVLALCSRVAVGGGSDDALDLDDELRARAMRTYEQYNREGFRVLAVACRDGARDDFAGDAGDERDMTLMGFVGFLDPPKESAHAAIADLRRRGVETVVLTGDSEGVARKVCEKVGIEVADSLTGSDVDALSDDELAARLATCRLFAKLSPIQKQRVVRLYQEAGKTVGYMGDGINDAPALKQADIGISVDTAVDIAKETAGIILLEKDLGVLDRGVAGGRKTFANVMKYLKMAVSGNFSNVLSLLLASVLLPFLPLKPIHVLIQNLVNDFAQAGMPFDNVDANLTEVPRKWNLAELRRFMITLGVIGSAMDMCCFAILWFVFGFNNVELATEFQTGWLTYGIISQTMVIHTIRTPGRPFVDSRPSRQLIISTTAVVLATLVVAFTDLAIPFDLSPLPLGYLPFMIAIVAVYAGAITLCKRMYARKGRDWL